MSKLCQTILVISIVINILLAAAVIQRDVKINNYNELNFQQSIINGDGNSAGNETKLVYITNETVTYQCYDGSLELSLDDCPEIPTAFDTSVERDFSGHGDTVSDVFYLKSGGLTIDYDSDDIDKRVAIYLIRMEDNKKLLLEHYATPRSGTTYYDLYYSGNYKLMIDASLDSDWSVILSQ